MAELKGWLMNGRYQWFISGNFKKETAIKIAKDIKEKMGTKGVAVEELPKKNFIKFKQGMSY